MSRLVWDKTGERFYETGVSMGVLYPMSDTSGEYEKGVVWNGLTSVSESPEGAEVTAIYADNIKYLNLMSAEDFKCTIEAYTYPDEFAACDGSAQVGTSGLFVTAQTRKHFAFSYQSKVGSDLTPDAGYLLHIIYGCLAAPSERSRETINDSPDAMTFSWEVSTTPVDVPNYKPCAHIIIDSRKADPDKLATVLDKLYGTDPAQGSTGPGTQPELLLPEEIIDLLK